MISSWPEIKGRTLRPMVCRGNPMRFQRPPRGLRGPRALCREFPGRLRGARTQYRSITDESYPAYLTAHLAGTADPLHAAAPVAHVLPVA